MVVLVQSIPYPAGEILALALGNGLVTAFEALVVSVQTARLVLCEFFARFLHVEGRVFKPAHVPGAAPQG